MTGWLRALRTGLFHRLFPAHALRRALARDDEREVELRVLPALVDPARIAVDVGANVGLYTGALLPLCARVIAFEPHPRLARILRAFPRDRVEVRRELLSDRAGQDCALEVELAGHREMDALAHVATGAPRAGARRFAVRSATLDQLAGEPIGFVKIDVEGHELAVLEGARGLIAAQAPVFLVEAETRHRAGAPGDVFAFFAGVGYSGFFLHAGQARAVAEYHPALQDEALLTGYRRREEAGYVNNFIFLPPGVEAGPVMAACAALLA